MNNQNIDLKLARNIDFNVRPQDDFYHFACGQWIKENPLKDEYSRFGTFDQLRENARIQLRELITTLGESEDAAVKDTIAQKVADIYALGMDEKRLNREGHTPLLPLLEKIENFNMEQLPEMLGWLQRGITTSFFGLGVGSDYKDSNINVLHLGETGLGLGDRDYYLEDNEEHRKIMEAYRKYIVRIMTLSGKSLQEAERVRDTVLEIEYEIAKHKMTREERRNPIAHYNPTSVTQLHQTYPNTEWKRIFDALGLENVESVNVINPAFEKFIDSYLPTLTEQQIKDFISFEVISESTGLLSDEFGDASFELYGKVMSGTKERKPRWKRAMAIPDSMLGEAVGQLYVQKYFPEANKKKMSELVENLRIALKKHIENLEWMSESTKAAAVDKLQRLTVKIGYPEKFKNYSEIHIDPAKSYLENVLAASRWYCDDNYKKLGKPVDKTEWHMTPQTVNAYYSPVSNEICFPAAILQPPYFDIEADDALNYGAIGVVIGHEMTHGFDDQGRNFDADGNLNEWWKKEDADNFNTRARSLAEQFNKIEILPGAFANGDYTLGENIADQGGLRIALTALESSKKETPLSQADMQNFFISYAGVWAENIREQEILSRIKTDPHSIGRLRVNATLRNLDTFMSAFNITADDKMWRAPENRIVIW